MSEETMLEPLKNDLVMWMLDHLPQVVEVKYKRIIYAFSLKIEINGGRGFNFKYIINEEYGSGWPDAAGEYLLRAWLDKKFGRAPSECLFFAEFVRTIEGLALAAMECYKLFRQHGLIAESQHYFSGEEFLPVMMNR